MRRLINRVCTSYRAPLRKPCFEDTLSTSVEKVVILTTNHCWSYSWMMKLEQEPKFLSLILINDCFWNCKRGNLISYLN